MTDPMSDWSTLPADLPVPQDDGAADHLVGRRLPPVVLPATDGRAVDLGALGEGRTVIYVYPRTGVPGVDNPPGWDEIPGARGCTPQSCSFRDHHADLLAAGAARVHGLSSQDTAYQQEAATRLHLPFSLLADDGLDLAREPGLPTFDVAGLRLYRRLTMVVLAGAVEHVWYPVFPPDGHAAEVLAWLRDHPAGAGVAAP